MSKIIHLIGLVLLVSQFSACSDDGGLFGNTQGPKKPDWVTEAEKKKAAEAAQGPNQSATPATGKESLTTP
jgi:hypothetical protein